MSWKSLSTPQMLERSTFWLGSGRAKFDAIPETRGALQLMERAHEALGSSSEQLDGAGELHRLTLELGQLDLLHDRRVRGIYHLLTGLGEALDDEQLASSLHLLRNELLPAGINTTLMSYGEQAVEAARAEARLDEERRALLERVVLPGGASLLEQVESWLEVGRVLGEMWAKREEVRKQTGGSPSDHLRARNRWIGALRVLMAALDAADIGPQERADLLNMPAHAMP